MSAKKISKDSVYIDCVYYSFIMPKSELRKFRILPTIPYTQESEFSGSFMRRTTTMRNNLSNLSFDDKDTQQNQNTLRSLLISDDNDDNNDNVSLI